MIVDTINGLKKPLLGITSVDVLQRNLGIIAAMPRRSGTQWGRYCHTPEALKEWLRADGTQLNT